MRFDYIFCFKQKTAYEMRISDWSSDVCSSDLHRHAEPVGRIGKAAMRGHLVEHDHVARPIEAAVPFVGRQRPLGNTILRRIVAIVEKVNLVKPGDDRETRSEERRVGKEGVRTGRSRWWPNH